MILKNKKGIERNFKVLLKVEEDNKKYIVYKDINTLNIYGGKYVKDKLLPLNNNEYEMINEIMKRVSE